MTVTWPTSLVPRNAAVTLSSFTKSGGRTSTGREQRVMSDAGFWRISYTVPIRTPQQVRDWNSMLDRLRSGEDIDVKVCGGEAPQGIDVTSTASLTVAAARRATRLTFETALILKAGHYFNRGSQMYRINRIVSTTGFYQAAEAGLPTTDAVAQDVATYEVDIMPPLRASLAVTAQLRFKDIVCLCVPADMNTGDLDLDLGRFADPTISFIEAL